MKTLLLSSLFTVALLSLAACEDGREHHHHDHDRDRGQTTTTTTEETTLHRPVGEATETRTIRSY